ncbi:MAG: OmpL47-type beta-barrel domain-containing protein, partial [bacterium]
DNVGNLEDTKSTEVKIDKTDPITTDDNSGEWYDSNTIINLSSSDTGSGVDYTEYCIDEDNTCDPSTTGTTPEVTCSEGSDCNKYVRYRSIDNVGNLEDTKSTEVKIDKSYPIIENLYILPNLAQTNDDLEGYVNASDVGGDNLTYIYKWYIDGFVMDSSISENYEESIEYNLVNLTSDNFNKGENVTLSVRAYDGVYYSDWENTSIIINNTNPVINNVSVSETNDPTDPTMIGKINASDTDNDLLFLEYIWYVNDEINESFFYDPENDIFIEENFNDGTCGDFCFDSGVFNQTINKGKLNLTYYSDSGRGKSNFDIGNITNYFEFDLNISSVSDGEFYIKGNDFLSLFQFDNSSGGRFFNIGGSDEYSVDKNEIQNVKIMNFDYNDYTYDFYVNDVHIGNYDMFSSDTFTNFDLFLGANDTLLIDNVKIGNFNDPDNMGYTNNEIHDFQYDNRTPFCSNERTGITRTQNTEVGCIENYLTYNTSEESDGNIILFEPNSSYINKSYYEIDFVLDSNTNGVPYIWFYGESFKDIMLLEFEHNGDITSYFDSSEIIGTWEEDSPINIKLLNLNYTSDTFDLYINNEFIDTYEFESSDIDDGLYATEFTIYSDQFLKIDYEKSKYTSEVFINQEYNKSYTPDFVPGNEIVYSSRVNDGDVYSDWTKSSTYTITNEVPYILSTNFYPVPNDGLQDLYFNFTANDTEQHEIYNYTKWYVNDTYKPDYDNLLTINESEFDYDDNATIELTIGDSYDNSTPTNYTYAFNDSTPPILSNYSIVNKTKKDNVEYLYVDCYDEASSINYVEFNITDPTDTQISYTVNEPYENDTYRKAISFDITGNWDWDSVKCVDFADNEEVNDTLNLSISVTEPDDNGGGGGG